MSSRPTTRSLFCQPDSDEESEGEYQDSALVDASSSLVKNAMSAIQYGDLSRREQRVLFSANPPLEISDSSSVFFNGVEYAVSDTDFSPTQRDSEIDGHQQSSSSSSSTSMRPLQGNPATNREWRYTIPPAPRAAGAVPAPPVASAANPPAMRTAAAPVAAADAAAPNMAPNPAPPAAHNVPEAVPPPPVDLNHPVEVHVPAFGATALGTVFVPEYPLLILPSAELAARFFARVSIHALEIGHVVLVLDSTTEIVSASTVTAPSAAYLVVNKLPDGSTDAVLAYSSSAHVAANYPKLLTFAPWIVVDQSTVVILNEAGVRARCLPTLMDVAKQYQVALIGTAAGIVPSTPAPFTSSMLYDTPESQLKREAREEKLAAIYVCLRGDLAAVKAFVGPARDLGHDAFLARIYPLLSVAQRTCPWARPECLPLFLQFYFSSSYLVLKGQGMNLTVQHLIPTSKLDTAAYIEAIAQLEQGTHLMSSGYTSIFCQPGSPLFKLDPMFFFNITVKILEQLRSTAHQSVYLGAIPINCVVQAFNGCLADFGAYMRDAGNTSLSFADFQAGAMATLDLKPKETVMGAHTSLHCQDLFVIPQFSRFDGKAPTSAAAVPLPSFPAQSRKRPLPQTGPSYVKQTRANPNISLPRGNLSRLTSAPVKGPPPVSIGQPARTGPPPSTASAPYICVSDFVTKLDGNRYPLGCTTPNCPRRHIPLPAQGQFAAADKAELLLSISRMKGTRSAPMLALVQGRN